MGILRLGHVDVTVTDLDLATAYYTEVIGLLETERDGDSVYLKCWDEPNHHSLRLTYGPRVGFDQMSFKVEHESDLDMYENKVQQWGYPVRRVSKGESVGQGESIRFETPSGQQMELVHDIEMVGRATASVNPAPFVEGLKGIAPPRLDHVLVTAEEVGDSAKFYMDVFGFRMTEQLLDGAGHQTAVWMETSHSPHDLAIVTGQERRAAPLRLVARRLGPRPSVCGHPRLQRHPDRRGPDAPRHHAWQHHLLLRSARHAQRGVHRGVPARPRLPDDHLDRGQHRPGGLLLRG